MNGLEIIGIFVLIAVGAATLVSRWGERNEPPGKVLYRHFQDRSDYRILVGIPTENPTSWAEVARVDFDSVLLADRSVVPLSEVTDYLVAYPGGSIVERCGNARIRLPRWATGLERSVQPDEQEIATQDLEAGATRVRVSYGRSTSHPRSRAHYSTTLTNISNRRIRVRKIGGYTKSGKAWVLNTVTGTFYSAQEFREWYGQRDEWIDPGESVTDPNNYGSPPVLWAYFCEDETEERFIAGGTLE